MRPEEKAAGLLVEQFDLRPPVDVQAQLEQDADLTIAPWPFDCDGLVVELASDRPKVFVRENTDRRRKRFTLAHELGHIVLGWHVEALGCHIDASLPNWLMVGREAEASRFASALLVPDRFLADIRSTLDVPAWLDAMTVADVSALAGVIGLVRGLPPGYLFVVEMPDGPKQVASAGPRMRLGWVEGQPDYAALDRSANRRGVVTHQGRRVRWYTFAEDELLPEPDTDPRPTTNLLRAALDRAARGINESSVSGVVAHAAGEVKTADANALHQHIMFRIKLRGDFQPLLDDPDFRTYIARRARTLAAKRSTLPHSPA